MSNNTLVKLFVGSMKYKIRNEKKVFQLQESGQGYKFEVPVKYSVGFQMEDTIKTFFDGSPIEGMARMSDAIFVARYMDKDFIIAVEIKTKNAGDFEEQLTNAGRFCQWIIQLFQDHHHYKGNPEYLGLLVLKENPSQPLKGKTTQNFEFDKFGFMKIYKQTGTYIDFRGILSNAYGTA